MMTATVPALDLKSIAAAYASGATSPTQLVQALYPQLAAAKGMFIHLAPLQQLLQRAGALEAQPEGSRGVLWGVPFATKDNVDVAGMPTTAACPSFSYEPQRSAPAVQALEDAGGINFGKTNMDQFASGLVGTRTPYGTAANAFDNRFIPGGSSSGSAAAVGAGLLCFALGTDTAGSGRVPAGYNGCVGLKGTLGKISTVGLVPACASLDCLTVFSRSVDDGAAIMAVMERGDAGPADVWRRSSPLRHTYSPGAPLQFKFGVPGPDFLDWAGPGGHAMAAASATAFAAAVARLQGCGGSLVPIDFSPFAQAAALLYQSSFVAERYSGLRSFLDQPSAGGAEEGAQAPADGGVPVDPVAAALLQQRSLVTDARLLPVTRAIISEQFTATDAFDDKARLAVLAAAARAQLCVVDCLLVPTVLEHYLLQEVADTEAQEPPSWPLNAKNGRFTNFVNLLDMCGIAVPAGLLTVDYAKPEAASSAQQRAERLAASGGPLRVVLPLWLWGVAAAMEQAAGLGCGPRGHGVAPVAVGQQ
ncbi:allophanate hydrolase [Scenedesmus sp. NREL 46B-D3]|nr:allophanate hydrolase [Scenedesmus sp. NREL 46B-D3]